MDNIKKGTIRKNIYLGLKVSIAKKEDRNIIIKGIVKEILTHKDHPYGIMVKLEDGTIGRVQDISPNETILILSNNKNINIDEIISKGENESIEYKSSVLWSLNMSNEDIKISKSRELQLYGKNASKIIIAKVVASFLNSEGGNLIIGIKENKDNNTDEIIGINNEFKKIKDSCIDGYRRMLIDSIFKHFLPSEIFNHLNKYINISFPQKKNKTLCWLNINKSENKVFLKFNQKDYFYIRIDAETRELNGKEMVDYCEKHFKQ